MSSLYHTHADYQEYIEGLGYLMAYRVDEPYFRYRPHFHIVMPSPEEMWRSVSRKTDMLIPIAKIGSQKKSAKF